MRDTGIDLIGNVSWGTHFCQFYQDKQDLLDILVPYFAAGLRQNEFCMWVTSEPLGVEEAKVALTAAVGDLEPYFRSGQLEILDYSQWYTAGGGFEADRVLKGWVDRLTAAQEKRFDGLRLTGNTFWLEASDWDNFAQYEATVDSVIGQYAMLAICTYSLVKCGAPEILDVMVNHAFALIKRDGAWQIIESAERRRTEAALRESEGRRRSLFDNMLNGYVYCRMLYENGTPTDFIFLDVNAPFERLTGLKDVVGERVNEAIPGIREANPELFEIFGRVARGGASEQFELYQDALSMWFSISVYSPENEHLVVVFDNITERKQAEQQRERLLEEVQRQRTLLETIIQHLRSGVVVVEADTQRILLRNEEYERVVGRPVPEGVPFITATPWKRLRPDGAEYAVEDLPPLRALVMGETVVDEEIEYVRTDGTASTVLVNAAPVRDGAGRVIAAVVTLHDITQRKRAAEALEEQVRIRTAELAAANEELRGASQYARSLIEASLDPLVTISPEGKITDVNEATVQVAGVPRAELIGTDFSDYFTEPEKARAGYQQVFTEGFVTDYPLTVRHKDGHLTDVLYNATVYRDVHGSVLGVFAAARDVTERNRAEEEVRRLNAELEQRVVERTAELVAANREMEAFTYSVSHDLRAPLRAMDGFSMALLEDYHDKLDGEAADYLARIRAASQRMAQLIDDLLQLSRITRGEMQRAPVDLSALARSLAGELQEAQPDRQVTFVIAEDVKAEGDARLLQLVLRNLLANAWKFTGKHSTARIEFGVTERESGRTFFVRDDGAGFDMTYANKLFGVFQRLHSDEAFEGTGIGLATVQRIVHRHGGHVWAEGAPEQGATFSFTLSEEDRLQPVRQT